MTTPQVVAHRGASHAIAEHTLAAYQEAIAVGTPAVECDVRLTVDHELVCIHDRTLKRVAAHRGVVSEMTLAELRELDFSSWKPGSPRGGVLTLRELFDTVRSAERRVELYVETKHPTRYRGAVEHKLGALLREYGWDQAGSPVTVISFQWTALQRMDRLAPDLDKVLLMDGPRWWPVYRRLIVRRDWMLGPRVTELRTLPGFTREVVETGRPLYVWTVNTDANLQVCLDLGARAVATDRPAWAMESIAGLARVADHGQEVTGHVASHGLRAGA